MDTNDFAAWNAARWAMLMPELGTDAALLAVRFISAADQLSRSHIETLAPWRYMGIASVDDFRTLAFIRLSDAPGPQAKAIVKALGSTRGTISNRLDRLEAEGWITRTQMTSDLRSHTLAIPEERTSDLDAMYRALVENHRAFFEPLTKTEKTTMIRGLAKLSTDRSVPFGAKSNFGAV